MSAPHFDGLRVLIFESRRARELASIVASYGGVPLSAPSMKEIPLESNTEALAFADGVERGEFDMVILLTGVGTRILVSAIERGRSQEAFLEALRGLKVVARGPKPLAVLREMSVPVWITAPEPNTWKELLAALDARKAEYSLRGARVAVQEYGAPNPELLDGLAARGARVTRVPVYQWALPDDLGPLQEACRATTEGRADIALFTTATQVVHLLKVAGMMGIERSVRDGLARVVVASIGPTTTEELKEKGIVPDIEASHPKMGFLVREVAERGPELVREKRASP